MDLKAAKRYVREHAIAAVVVQRRPFTFAQVRVPAHGPIADLDYEIIGVGFSKVMWPDRWGTARGCAIARGKAEVDAARQLLTQKTGGEEEER